MSPKPSQHPSWSLPCPQLPRHLKPISPATTFSKTIGCSVPALRRVATVSISASVQGQGSILLARGLCSLGGQRILRVAGLAEIELLALTPFVEVEVPVGSTLAR
ncbi:MAG: hypothetical protein K0Q96_443 [Rubrobacteraceae bacterium]|nr:hypothetical protein [Rubrobacteraceae bacterium]